MTTTLLHDAPPAPQVSPRLALVPAGRGRWRVLDEIGRALGHLERRETVDGPRFGAQRFHVPSRSFREVGEFWSAREAAECLRLSR